VTVPPLISGTRLCAAVDVDDGAARVVEIDAGPPPLEVIVIRRDGDWIGYYNRCRHMAVPLNMLATVFVAGEALVCDHHGARFRVGDGYCTTGPCKGESLIPVALRERDGTIVVA
jgi:nitrite reductase/ring-hydroxylating ferredoxin subunit